MKRRNLLRIIIAVSCLAITAAAYIVLTLCSQNGKKAHTYGSVAAIKAAFLSDLNRKDTNLKEILSPVDDKWRFLTPEQYDRVIIELNKLYSLDPSPASGQPLLDLWGNRFEIAYHQLSNQDYDVIVVSKGPDGIYGTKDDIVSDYGVAPPAKIDK